MDKRRRNKENQNPENSRKISDMFKVKKCLFDSPQESMKFSAESPLLEHNLVTQQDDSPFSMFHIRKRHSQGIAGDKYSHLDDSTPLKKVNKIAFLTMENDVSMTSPQCSVKVAVQKSMTETNLIGDFSKQCLLPIINGSHPDLKTVGPATIAKLLTEKQSLTFKLFDCRYPYEYEGGHIKDAVNVYYKGEVETNFFSPAETADKIQKNEILIFYCEFSSQRAPNMMRFLRSRDRDLNKDCYPFLFYPELYLMEGGYKAFYSCYKELCEPQLYKTMLDKEFSSELSFYRSKCKSYSMKSKRGKRVRSAALFLDL